MKISTMYRIVSLISLLGYIISLYFIESTDFVKLDFLILTIGFSIMAELKDARGK